MYIYYCQSNSEFKISSIKNNACMCSNVDGKYCFAVSIQNTMFVTIVLDIIGFLSNEEEKVIKTYYRTLIHHTITKTAFSTIV